MLQAADRRRVLIASLLTLVALPFLWTAKQGNSSSQGGGVAAIGNAGGIDLGIETVTTISPAGDASFVGNEPGYLGAGVEKTAPGTIALSIKATPSGHHIDGGATYRDLKPGGNVCQTMVVPWGSTLHVTDTDNGRTVDCRVTDSAAPPAGVIIVLGSDAFRVLADVVEAPIPVELNW